MAVCASCSSKRLKLFPTVRVCDRCYDVNAVRRFAAAAAAGGGGGGGGGAAAAALLHLLGPLSCPLFRLFSLWA